MFFVNIRFFFTILIWKIPIPKNWQIPNYILNNQNFNSNYQKLKISQKSYFFRNLKFYVIENPNKAYTGISCVLDDAQSESMERRHRH